MKTNVLFMSLPIRYDNAILNEEVHMCNSELFNGTLADTVKLIPFNNIHRKYFTNHGQHLNRAGQFILISKIIGAVQEKNSHNFLG